MNFHLKRIHYPTVILKVCTGDNEVSETNNNAQSPELLVGHHKEDGSTKEFSVVIVIELHSEKEKFHIKVEAIGDFIADGEIDDEFMKGPFVNVNAPAIIYPYVRSFISNLTLNGGYNPLILPTVNFVALAEQKKQQENEDKTKKDDN